MEGQSQELLRHSNRKLCEGYGVDSDYMIGLQQEFYNEGARDGVAGATLFIAVVLILVYVVKFTIRREIP